MKTHPEIRTTVDINNVDIVSNKINILNLIDLASKHTISNTISTPELIIILIRHKYEEITNITNLVMRKILQLNFIILLKEWF